MKYLTSFDTKKQKAVRCGYVENGVYHKNVNNRHYMVKERGYGISTDVFVKMIDMGVRNIVVHTKTKDLKATVNAWVSRGHRVDYGSGEQIFLCTDFMEEI